MKVKVYYNSRKRCLSVVSEEGEQKGRVVFYTDSIYLTNVVFKVSEAGRQRVLRTHEKNVHAWVCGILSSALLPEKQASMCVTYNPYKYDTFVDVENKTPIYKAAWAFISGKKIFVE